MAFEHLQYDLNIKRSICEKYFMEIHECIKDFVKISIFRNHAEKLTELLGSLGERKAKRIIY